MCFNGAKSWQLGWFADRHVMLTTSSYEWYGDLVGFSEKDSASPGEALIIRIDAGNSDYYYVHYNRKSGFNNGSKEGNNKVLVAIGGSGTSYTRSTLEAKLDEDDSYQIENFNGSGYPLMIEVNQITTSGTPRRASISIYLDAPPPTVAPVSPPTSPPTIPPTNPPTAPPTDQPIAPPTDAPAVPPTPSPVVQGPCGVCGPEPGANTPECNGQPEETCLRMIQYENKCTWNECNTPGKNVANFVPRCTHFLKHVSLVYHHSSRCFPHRCFSY